MADAPPPTGDGRSVRMPRSRRQKGWDFGFRQGGDLNREGAMLLFGLLVMVGVLAALYLALVSYTALQALHVQELRDTLIQLQAENALLERQIGERHKGLLEKAVQMGFVPASQVETVGP